MDRDTRPYLWRYTRTFMYIQIFNLVKWTLGATLLYRNKTIEYRSEYEVWYYLANYDEKSLFIRHKRRDLLDSHDNTWIGACKIAQNQRNILWPGLNRIQGLPDRFDSIVTMDVSLLPFHHSKLLLLDWIRYYFLDYRTSIWVEFAVFVHWLVGDYPVHGFGFEFFGK